MADRLDHGKIGPRGKGGLQKGGAADWWDRGKVVPRKGGTAESLDCGKLTLCTLKSF